MRSRRGRGGMMFIERTEVFKGNLRLCVFVQMHKQILWSNAEPEVAVYSYANFVLGQLNASTFRSAPPGLHGLEWQTAVCGLWLMPPKSLLRDNDEFSEAPPPRGAVDGRSGS